MVNLDNSCKDGHGDVYIGFVVGFCPQYSGVSQSLILFAGSPEPTTGIRRLAHTFFYCAAAELLTVIIIFIMETKKNQGIAMYECPKVEVMNIKMETIVCVSPGGSEGVGDEEVNP